MDERNTDEMPALGRFSIPPMYGNDLERTIGVLQLVQREFGDEITLEEVIQLLIGKQLERMLLERKSRQFKSINEPS